VSPINHFEAVWARCDHLSAIHAYLARNVSPALQPDELLRTEWASRVGALDLYVHELIAQRLVGIFQGELPKCPGYATFQLPTETMDRIRGAATPTDASAAFDLTVREQLGRKTFQYPEDIAAGLRLCSAAALWSDVAVKLGATPQSKDEDAKRLKRELTQIVGRRNKIVHEGDLQPTVPRVPWPITQADVAFVSALLESIVRAVDAVA
jgi:hypothetical protein